MKAVILAGGEGTRLRPLTCTVPKSMVPVLNRPFLEHVLARLAAQGVSEAVLALYHLPEAVRQYFGDGRSLGLRLSYSIEERPLGTAGAVTKVEDSLKETFGVLNGDIFTDLDLPMVVAYHRERKSKATIVLTPVEDPSPYGVVETDPQGRVLRFREKPRSDEMSTLWVNAGTYVLEPEVLARAPRGEPFSFEYGLFPRLIEAGVPVYAYRSSAYWMDLGTPRNYLALHRHLLLGRAALPLLGPPLRAGVWAGEGCTLHPSAQVRGPLLLGKGCHVGAGVRLTGPAVLGDGCAVEEEASVQGAVLWAGARVGPRAAVSRSVMGRQAQVEEGASVEGCILGDGVVVGAGYRLERGMAVWPGIRLAPGAVSFTTLE